MHLAKFFHSSHQRISLCYLLWINLLWPFVATAAARKQYFSADKYESEHINGEDVIKCTGNFVFKKDDVHIYADEAYWNEKKKLVDIRKQVKILRVHKKTKAVKHTITAERLLYYRKTQMAKVLGSVVLVEADKRLTSDEGLYDEKHDNGCFQGHVCFTSEKEHLTCSQLSYNQLDRKTRKTHKDLFGSQRPKEVFTAQGNVVILVKKEDITLYGEQAFFDKINDQAKICGQAMLKKKLDRSPLFLMADSFLLLKDPDAEVKPTPKDNATDQVDDTIPKKTKQKKTVVAEGNSKKTELTTDSEEDEPGKHYLTAKGLVRLYNKELQGQAGELRYFPRTRLAYLDKQPTLWSDESQFSAEKVVLGFDKEQIEKIELTPYAHTLQLDKQKNHNQIKGKAITLNFEAGKLKTIDVVGDPESVFFLLEEDEAEADEAPKADVAQDKKQPKKPSFTAAPPKLAGMNHAWSEKIHITVENNEITTIQLQGKTRGMIHPPGELNALNSKIGGFTWRGAERLTAADVDKRLSYYQQPPLAEEAEPEPQTK